MRSIVTFLVCTLGTAALAHAQVEPTAEQKKLDDRAYEAVQAGDEETAAEFYRRSIEIGPLNVTHLNLGRVLQKQGKCEPAWEQFELARTAPTVSRPSPDAVDEALRRYEAELSVACPTILSVTCADEDAKISVNDGPFLDCPREIEVPPGLVHVRASHSGGRAKESVEVGPGRRVSLSFVAIAPVADAATPGAGSDGRPAKPESGAALDLVEVEPKPGLDWGALDLAVGGLALGLAAFALDGGLGPWPHWANDYRLGSADFIPIVGYVGAIGLVTYSLIDLFDGPEDE